MTNIKGIKWLGVETDKFEELSDFYESVFGLKDFSGKEGQRMYEAGNGDVIEIFDAGVEQRSHFGKGVVAGFEVSDIEKAKIKMEKIGIEFLGEIQGHDKSERWAHFLGVDGNVYEIIEYSLEKWSEIANRLKREFKFKSFVEALDFVKKVGEVAEEMNHHPEVRIFEYNKVEMCLQTHSEGRVTEKDWELARRLDKVL